eukprot:gene34260-42248_t
MEGTGTMKYYNGDVYTGQWRDYKRNGNGVFTAKNRCKITGLWLHDVLLTGGQLTKTDMYSGQWGPSYLRQGTGTSTDLQT